MLIIIRRKLERSGITRNRRRQEEERTIRKRRMKRRENKEEYTAEIAMVIGKSNYR